MLQENMFFFLKEIHVFSNLAVFKPCDRKRERGDSENCMNYSGCHKETPEPCIKYTKYQISVNIAE